MPRSCLACGHAETAAISKAAQAGETNQALAKRFGLSTMSVQRHRVNCLKSPRRQKTDEKIASESSAPTLLGSARFASLEPKALVSATAELVDQALSLLESAKKADDRRTALVALKEARDGLALLMKAAGMLANDGVNVTIDARQQSVSVLARLSEEELRALAYGKPIALASAVAETSDVVDVIEASTEAEAIIQRS